MSCLVIAGEQELIKTNEKRRIEVHRLNQDLLLRLTINTVSDIIQTISAPAAIPSFKQTIRRNMYLKTTMKNSSSLSVVSVTHNSGSLLCDNSTAALRPLLPEVLSKPLFYALHNVFHPGVRGSQRLISACFVWLYLARDVRAWARACL